MRGVRGPQLDNSHSHSEREPSYRSQRCDQMLIDTILYCDDVIGKDIIGLAETGSGKTAAFALPILQALLDTPTRLFALVLTPTRLVQLTSLSLLENSEAATWSLLGRTSCQCVHCSIPIPRELAFQISEQFEALGSGIGVKCGTLFGSVWCRTPPPSHTTQRS